MMIITHDIFFNSLRDFKIKMQNYAIENNKVPESYYVSKVILQEITKQVYYKKNYQDFGVWLINGGTLRLKNILLTIEYYDDSDLSKFNGFSYLDSFSCNIHQSQIKLC